MTATTWNPADAANCGFSTDLLTVFRGQTGSFHYTVVPYNNCGARGTNGHSAAQLYFELTFVSTANSLGTPTDVIGGVCTGAASLNLGGAQPVPLGAIGVGLPVGTSVIGFAVDFTAGTVKTVSVAGIVTVVPSGVNADTFFPVFGNSLGLDGNGNPIVTCKGNFDGPFTYSAPAGYISWDGDTISNAGTLSAPARLSTEAVDVIRDALAQVRLSSLGVDVLHDGDNAQARLSTMFVEVLRGTVAGNLIPRAHTSIIG